MQRDKCSCPEKQQIRVKSLECSSCHLKSCRHGLLTMLMQESTLCKWIHGGNFSTLGSMGAEVSYKFSRGDKEKSGIKQEHSGATHRLFLPVPAKAVPDYSIVPSRCCHCPALPELSHPTLPTSLELWEGNHQWAKAWFLPSSVFVTACLAVHRCQCLSPGGLPESTWFPGAFSEKPGIERFLLH